MQIVFHINNAIKPHDEVWQHMLIARAIENGVFVCSVNNAAPPQRLAPASSTRPDACSPRQRRSPIEIVTCEIDLSAVIPRLDERLDF